MGAEHEEGFSLLETMIALLILLVVTLGILPLTLLATSATENGHLMARTTEYAQDKLEQLLALTYGDATSDTRIFPTADVGGSGLIPGGSATPGAPVALYVDYLDISGTLVPSVGVAEPAGWFYKRAWQVTVPRANLKQVTVTAIVRRASAGGTGQIPQATVVALKSFPF